MTTYLCTMVVVGIIGSGVSGLCAARHALTYPNVTPVVWEQADQLGGTWRLSNWVGKDERGLPVHSSMYHSLRTDIPTVVMAFPDFPFPEGNESFVHHTTVLKYLEDYAHHYNLLQHIKFGQQVKCVEPVVKGEGGTAWRVIVQDLQSGDTNTTICDAIIVCNGHFTKPNLPTIPNLDSFQGQAIHSHNYRHPSLFTANTVVVLGASTSGLDIALELSSVASHVLLSHNYPLQVPTALPPNIRQVTGVVSASKDGFTFADGTMAQADAIIFCTGYKYSFPFLSDDCGVSMEDNHVKPLYHHIINAQFPTMAFIGIPSRTIGFSFIDYQVRYFLATLTGGVKLGDTTELMAAVAEEETVLKQEGVKEKHYHILATKQFQYMEDRAREAGLEKPASFQQKLMQIVLYRLLFSFPIFKHYNYSLTKDGEIVEVKDGVQVNTGRDLNLLMVRRMAALVWNDFGRVVRLLTYLVFQWVKRVFTRA